MAFKMKGSPHKTGGIQGSRVHKKSIARAMQPLIGETTRTKADASLVNQAWKLGQSFKPTKVNFKLDIPTIKLPKGDKEEEEEIKGCTYENATNYNPDATVDDGSCIPIIYGCTDPSSWSYNPDANVNDGSCIYFGCTDPSALNYDPAANVDNGTCIYPIYGCTDPEAFNYDPEANVDDGSCIPVIYGCMDPTMFNFNPIANTDNGSCIPVIFGCTDSTSLNYDPTANTDNGTCILPLSGCTDPNAFNYDPTANVTDSSACLYDAGCVGGPGEPYWLNDPCFAWVIDVDVYCCEVEWDASCQSMYNYCVDGWPVGIDEMDVNGIIVYPNPTNNTLNIETHLSFTYELRNAMGKLMLTGKDKRLELGKYSDGVYFLTIIHNEKKFNKRIIKQ